MRVAVQIKCMRVFQAKRERERFDRSQGFTLGLRLTVEAMMKACVINTYLGIVNLPIIKFYDKKLNIEMKRKLVIICRIILIFSPFCSYNMMTDCWKENPEGRPTFTQIRERLEEMMQKDNPYLDLSAVDETREYYNVPSFNSLMEAESVGDDLLDNDKQDCHRDSNETVELDNQKPAGDSNENITESLKQTEEKNNSQNTVTDDGYCTIEIQGVKDVKINFNELEMSLCRPARRAGIAF